MLSHSFDCFHAAVLGPFIVVEKYQSELVV